MLARLKHDLAEAERRRLLARKRKNARAMHVEDAKIKEIKEKIARLRAANRRARVEKRRPAVKGHRRPTVERIRKRHPRKPYDKYEGVAVNCRNATDMYKHYAALARKWVIGGKVQTIFSPLHVYYVRRRNQARAFMRKCSSPAMARKLAKLANERREIAAKIAVQKKLAAAARARRDVRQAQQHEQAAENYERRERELKVIDPIPPEPAGAGPAWSPTAPSDIIRAKDRPDDDSAAEGGGGRSDEGGGKDGDDAPAPWYRRYGILILGGLAVGAAVAFGGKGKGGGKPLLALPSALAGGPPRSFTARRPLRAPK